jgi:hypothetical protein
VAPIEDFEEHDDNASDFHTWPAKSLQTYTSAVISHVPIRRQIQQRKSLESYMPSPSLGQNHFRFPATPYTEYRNFRHLHPL